MIIDDETSRALVKNLFLVLNVLAILVFAVLAWGLGWLTGIVLSRGYWFGVGLILGGVWVELERNRAESNREIDDEDQ